MFVNYSTDRDRDKKRKGGGHLCGKDGKHKGKREGEAGFNKSYEA